MNPLWGLMFRASGDRVRATFPGWLARTPAIYIMIDYIEMCVRRMYESYGVYRYEQSRQYVFFVQTSDAAECQFSSLALGRIRGLYSAIRLIPDLYFIQQRGYSNLRALIVAGRLPAWGDRQQSVIWRGSTTGEGPFASPAEMPRIRLVELCRRLSCTDVKIMGVPETIRRWLPQDKVERYVLAEGLHGARIPMAQHSQFKFTIDIDGRANAWSFLEKLLLGCCVLKIGSHYEQWFYDRIRPWEHFVPIQKDLSDLPEKIEWCFANDGLCKEIAHNGMAVALSLRFDAEVSRTCHEIMSVVDAA